ncbi:hypothetical protein B8W95_13285, partial [Staphylococcus pasteuri]
GSFGAEVGCDDNDDAEIGAASLLLDKGRCGTSALGLSIGVGCSLRAAPSPLLLCAAMAATVGMTEPACRRLDWVWFVRGELSRT